MKRASKVLSRSWQDCQKYYADGRYPVEEMDRLELLSSRFSRLVDYIIQKILRLIDEIDLETPGTIRDLINRAEKKNLITNAELLIDARILRNKIAHEYVEEVMTEIFLEAMRLVPPVLDAVKRIESYASRYKT